MSREALEAVIGRAVINEEFRLALFADPDATLAGEWAHRVRIGGAQDTGR